MKTQLSGLAADYVRSINGADAVAFRSLFADDATVNDNGRELRGSAAIEAWSESDIFAPKVTLEVLDVTSRDGQTVLTTRVEGNFDRTGLPDPVIIRHHLRAEGERIVELRCELAR